MSMRSLLVISLVLCAAASWAQEKAAPAAAPVAGTPVTLENPGFEKPDISSGAAVGAKPDAWFPFASTPVNKVGVSDARKKTGSQSLMFKAQTEPNAYQGMAQKFTAKSGAHYTFVIYAMGEANDPITGNAYGQIHFEFQDAAGKEIGRIHGPTWDFQLPSTRWEKFYVDADAPEGAASGSAVVTFFSQDCAGVGTFYVDDVELSTR